MKHCSTIIAGILIVLLVGGSLLAFTPAPYDTVTIYDLQYVPNPDSNDLSPRLGDTVVVKGLVMNGPRDLWVGARWAVYIVDPDSFPKPWSGFFVIQHDTFQTATNFQFVQPGWICYFTGVVSEFNHFSQVALLTNPPVPIDIVSTGNPIPDPVVLTCDDLKDRASFEKWESMWVRVENARVVNNAVPGNWASITDYTGAQTFIGEYFNWFRDRLMNGTYSWPANGTRLNVNGFTREETAGITINPRTPDDLEILSNPPKITDVRRSPAAPTSSDNVTISATITDNGTVDTAKVWYSVNWGPFQPLQMTANVDTFSAVIPAQSDGAFVRYFVTAIDNDGDFSMVPGDTSMATGRIYFYVVRDGGLSIKDVQYTWGYASDASGYEGYEVTLQGIVTTDSTDFSGSYWIEEDSTRWSGIWVRNNSHQFAKGDLIEVTGTVQESFGMTRLTNVTAASVVTPGVGVPPAAPVKTGDIATGGKDAEAYESVLVKVQNLTVTNPFPDSPRNFGEFMVSDGSGDLRVDDYSIAFRGNLDSAFALNDHIDSILAIHYYSYGNYKIIPRDTNDIYGHTTAINEPGQPIPLAFDLKPNYPNPFNPNTTIEYTIADKGKYELAIYNVLGQKVRTLVNATLLPGKYRVTWDGLSDAGQRVSSGIYFYTLKGKNLQKTHKMILMK